MATPITSSKESVNRHSVRKGSRLLAAVVMLFLASAPAASARNANPEVLPPQSQAYGGYAQLAARWWQWAFGVPAATNPVLDPTGVFCAEGQSGNVWLLAGTFGGDADRTCTIPRGSAIFIPLFNSAWGAPIDCGAGDLPGLPAESYVECDIATLRQQAADAVAGVEEGSVTLAASIDGRELTDLLSYRAQSTVFDYTLPEGDVLELFYPFDIPAGTYGPVVADGYWILLRPLGAGSHVIEFSASDFLTVAYHLTVAS